MLKSFAASAIAVAILVSPQLARSQAASAEPQRGQDGRRLPLDKRVDGWLRPVAVPSRDQKSAPAPAHDISGIWDPGDSGIQALGPSVMPDDGKPQHQPPFTPLGLQMLKDTKPSNG